MRNGNLFIAIGLMTMLIGALVLLISGGEGPGYQIHMTTWAWVGHPAFGKVNKDINS